MDALSRLSRRRGRSTLLAALALFAAPRALPAAPAPSPAPPASGDVVAQLEVEVPFTGSFVLHGTVPLPPGTWQPGGTVPLGVRNPDGSIATTQMEVVSRYAKPADGVDVAEVIARVMAPAGAAVGARVRYDVVLWPTAPAPGPGAPGLEDLKATQGLPSSVLGLLASPASLEIRAEDVFGNVYRVRPLDGTGTIEVKRHGKVQSEIRVSQTMMPVAPIGGPTATLPHFLGVHTYLSVTSGEEVVGFDVRIHDGHSGRDAANPLDDPLGKVYFRRIQILVPPGWVPMQDYLDPFVGVDVGPSGIAYDLVRPLPEGRYHVMNWQQQFHRRLVVAPVQKLTRAVTIARGGGLGFARRGKAPGGAPFWSWWNLGTSRWFPQAHPLPGLEHVGHAALRSSLSSELAKIQKHLELGTSDGTFPVEANVLGWAHPYGIAYGGMTSGTEINLFDGIEIVESASTDGYRRYRILHRMNTDRMPVILYDADGTPSTIAEWLVIVPNGKSYVPFSHFITPLLGSGQDPFGLWKVSTYQADVVQALGLQPSYEPTLESFSAYDFQHYIRYTRVAKVLAWLANDSVAKDDLLALAEVFKLSYHPFYNSGSQYVQVSGMRYDLEHVLAHPGQGVSFGRGEAWGLDTMNAVYAFGTPEWRSANLPWFLVVADMLCDGQGTCTGFIHSDVTTKVFEGKYRMRQAIEHAIVENAILGSIQRVFVGVDPGYTAMLTDVLRKSLYAAIGPMAWSPGETAPWAITATGPADLSQPAWCFPSQIPSDGLSDWTDSWQNWSSFAYGFELTLDPVFLQFAELQIGGPLASTLKAQGTSNLPNRAALLALEQFLTGEL